MKLVAKYAEPLLKGPKERKRLERILRSSIKEAFPNIKISMNNGVIEIASEADISDGLSRVFGINQVYASTESGKKPEQIAKTIAECADRAKKYKIEVKRRDKSYPLDSIKAAQMISELLDANGMKMSVRGYDEIIYIDIGKEKADCMFNRKEGVAGLPYGSGGKALMLFSGGIDSPVATYLLARRGLHLDALYIGSPVMAKQVKRIWEHLKDRYYLRGEFYFADNSEAMKALASIESEFRQMGLKAAFYRIAERVADETGAEALATGESIGQVSTQTLSNIALLNGLSKRLVLRPLVGMTKDDIIIIARRIGTLGKSECLPEMCKVSPKPRVRMKEGLFFKIDAAVKEGAERTRFGKD
jgi:thiamine biosynthesis protein ThiI